MASVTRRTSVHGQWTSRTAFILAVTGSAVGLGNIWKFPYIAGENGGGAFVLFYLACVFAIGLPIMMSEVLIGRRGRRNPITTMLLLGQEEAGTTGWRVVGIIGVLGAFIILSFYSVFAGWALAYVLRTALGTFSAASPQAVTDIFDSLQGNWVLSGLWHTLFMVLTVLVVARGVQRGLERAVRILMPSLLFLLLILLGYSISTGFFAEGVRYMFHPDFGELSAQGMLVALGHAFFTLSVGMGAVMAYGAYLPEGTSIVSTSVAVVIADTTIALLAGLVIFPIVFANGLDPGAGPGLLFKTLPVAFGQMPLGALFGTLFFVMLAFAAWTSSIGLLEPAVAWLMESRRWSRTVASCAVGGAVWLLGFSTVLSFNVLDELQFLHGTLYENVDHLASNIMLPLAGLLITIFAGWVMCRNSSCDELDLGTGRLYKGWRFLTRFVAPGAVVLVFLHAHGVLI